jgi:AbrB family looped-hinge helix DNA binding protein
MYEYKTKINENGRLVIPAIHRKALGIKPGDEVIMRIEDDELHISNIKRALRRARGLVKHYIGTSEDLTESLISDRRKEALRE